MAITEVMTSSPKVSIAVFSVIVTLISTLVQKYFTDQEHLKALKKRQKEIQKEIKKAGSDASLMQELNAEMLQLTGLMFKKSMRPLFVTMIPFLLLFMWLRGVYSPVLSGWIWWYIGYSVLASIILRKVLKVA